MNAKAVCMAPGCPSKGLVPESEVATHPCCQVGDGWRPIESAPEMTPVLAYWTRFHGIQNVAMRDGDRWFSMPLDGTTFFTAPNNWQPLPPPPQQPSRSEPPNEQE